MTLESIHDMWQKSNIPSRIFSAPSYSKCGFHVEQGSYVLQRSMKYSYIYEAHVSKPKVLQCVELNDVLEIHGLSPLTNAILCSYQVCTLGCSCTHNCCGIISAVYI